MWIAFLSIYPSPFRFSMQRVEEWNKNACVRINNHFNKIILNVYYYRVDVFVRVGWPSSLDGTKEKNVQHSWRILLWEYHH